MNANERALGMDRPISRRDFVNGVSAAAAGALLLPKWALAMEDGQDFAPEQAAGYYPPAMTGMRGDHPGSFEVAHALRDRRSVDLTSATHTGETFDLVVVGAGMSGLAAAYYFYERRARREGSDPRQPRRFRRSRQAQRIPSRRQIAGD